MTTDKKYSAVKRLSKLIALSATVILLLWLSLPWWSPVVVKTFNPSPFTIEQIEINRPNFSHFTAPEIQLNIDRNNIHLSGFDYGFSNEQLNIDRMLVTLENNDNTQFEKLSLTELSKPKLRSLIALLDQLFEHNNDGTIAQLQIISEAMTFAFSQINWRFNDSELSLHFCLSDNKRVIRSAINCYIVTIEHNSPNKTRKASKSHNSSQYVIKMTSPASDNQSIDIEISEESISLNNLSSNNTFITEILQIARIKPLKFPVELSANWQERAEKTSFLITLSTNASIAQIAKTYVDNKPALAGITSGIDSHLTTQLTLSTDNLDSGMFQFKLSAINASPTESSSVGARQDNLQSPNARSKKHFQACSDDRCPNLGDFLLKRFHQDINNIEVDTSATVSSDLSQIEVTAANTVLKINDTSIVLNDKNASTDLNLHITDFTTRITLIEPLNWRVDLPSINASKDTSIRISSTDRAQLNIETHSKLSAGTQLNGKSVKIIGNLQHNNQLQFALAGVTSDESQTNTLSLLNINSSVQLESWQYDELQGSATFSFDAGKYAAKEKLPSGKLIADIMVYPAKAETPHQLKLNSVFTSVKDKTKEYNSGKTGSAKKRLSINSKLILDNTLEIPLSGYYAFPQQTLSLNSNTQLPLQQLNQLIAVLNPYQDLPVSLDAGKIDFSLNFLKQQEKNTLKAKLAGTDVKVLFSDNSITGLDFEQNIQWPAKALAKGFFSADEIGFKSGLKLSNIELKTDVLASGELVARDFESHLFDGAIKSNTLTWRNGELKPSLLNIEDLDLTQLIFFLDIDGLYADGKLSGELPIQFLNGELLVNNAQLAATEKGTIKYDNGQPVTEEDLALFAIRNFQYKQLDLTLDYLTGGRYPMRVHLLGANPELYDGYPIDFVINLDGQLPDGFRSLFLTGDFEQAVTKMVSGSDLTKEASTKQ